MGGNEFSVGTTLKPSEEAKTTTVKYNWKLRKNKDNVRKHLQQIPLLAIVGLWDWLVGQLRRSPRFGIFRVTYLPDKEESFVYCLP